MRNWNKLLSNIKKWARFFDEKPTHHTFGGQTIVWTRVTEVDGNTFYVNFEKIRKHGRYVYWLELLDLEEPAENGHLSNISYIQGDCKQFRIKDLSFHWYKRPLGSGVGIKFTPSNKWTYPQTNGAAETVLKSVCSYAKKISD